MNPQRIPPARQLMLAATLLCLQLGLAERWFSLPESSLVHWHPSTGLGLAVLLLGGVRYGWAVWLGALASRWLTDGVSISAVVFSVGDLAGPLCAAWCLLRLAGFSPSLVSLKDYALLMAGGALGAVAGGLVKLAFSLPATMVASAALGSFLRGWMGDILGVALVTPALLVWWIALQGRSTRAQWREFVLVLGLSILAGQMVFLDWFTDAQHRAPIGYWMFLFVGWAALRLGRAGVAIVLSVVATQALVGVHQGTGFFANDLANTRLLGLWLYTLMLAVLGMGLAIHTTQTRLAAHRLQREQYALRNSALDKVQEGVTIGGPQREFVYVNDAFVTMTGYSRQELLGQRCGTLLQGPGTDPQTVAEMRAAMNAKQPFRTEILNYRKDGTPFWNELSITPIFDAQGHVAELFAVQRDISARHQAAQDLAAAHAKASEGARILDALMAHIPEGITIADAPDVRIRMVSRYGIELTGKSAKELEGIPVDQQVDRWDIYAADAVTPARGEDLPLTRATQKGELIHDEEWVLGNAYGRRIPLLCNAAPIRDTQGQITGGIVAWRDMTEMKAQQTRLKLAEQVLTQANEGVTVTDAQGQIILVNQAFTHITGYTADDVVGKNPRLLSSGRHDTAFYQAFWAQIIQTGSWSGEIWNRRKNGEIYPEWLHVSAIRDDHGHITNYVGSFSDLSETKAVEQQIQWLSNFDSVTGLPNRSLLMSRTDQAIAMGHRAHEPLAMLMIGIDHFKTINETLGYSLGDALLREVARRLEASVRNQDTVARLGGNQFVLVLPGTTASGAAHLATELLWKLATTYQLDTQEASVTASIGVATYPDNGSCFDDLVKASEIALHRAQHLGRDNFQFYSEVIYQSLTARDQLFKALRHAVALDQLQLMYQPLVDLQTGQISGMEALLRWTHPDLGAVSPAQFIPVAEESGLIKGIGEWVLRRACRDIRHWLDMGIKVPHVAVNVSPLQFKDTELISQVQRALADHQVDASHLYIEVTESALMDDVQRSEDMLRQLKDLGIKLSLDDFGTGYSSLSYLKRFPFDKVKIDQSFVRDITTDQSDTVIVKVIVSMAHGLGMRVIAEGVETEAQCEIMRTNVCDEIQGYFFSRPVSKQAIEDLFSEGRQLPAHLLRLQKPQRTLLLVDDEPNVVSALKRLFRPDGHLVLTAHSGAQGLEMLSRHRVDIIIADQRMPGMTGVEFLRAAKATYPNTIRIVLSGYTELQSVTDAINEGAVYRFLTKPWDDDQLREHVQKAFEYKELLEENQQLDIKIRTANQELVAANRQLGMAIGKTNQQIDRDKTSLAIVREALQYIRSPIMGIDDENLVTFVNEAAQQLFASAGPLLGNELPHVLPMLAKLIASTGEDQATALHTQSTQCTVRWHAMGKQSRSKGKLITFTTEVQP